MRNCQLNIFFQKGQMVRNCHFSSFRSVLTDVSSLNQCILYSVADSGATALATALEAASCGPLVKLGMEQNMVQNCLDLVMVASRHSTLQVMHKSTRRQEYFPHTAVVAFRLKNCVPLYCLLKQCLNRYQ
jgi:hypothetical protein